MSDALHQFLQERARNDYRDLDLLRPLIDDAIDLEEYNKHAMAKMMTYAYQIGMLDAPKYRRLTEMIEHKLGINPARSRAIKELFNREEEYTARIKSPEFTWPLKLQPETTDFLVTQETLRLAGNLGLSMAGEACKKIERTRPELIRQFPDFPWTSLKRLRNYNSHPARYAHDPELQQQQNDAAENEIKKFETSIRNHWDVLPLNDTTMLALSAGIRLYVGMRILAKSANEGGLIPLQGTSAVKDACYVLSADQSTVSFKEEVLPHFVIEQASHSLRHEIHDTLGRISCFYRWRTDSILNNANLKPMLHLRNRVAHFAGTLRPRDWQKTTAEAEPLSQTILKLSEMLDNVPSSENTAQVEQFIGDLTALYTSNLLGEGAKDPVKHALLNNTIEKLTHAHLDENTENAYVQTAALLIQRTSAERAGKVLDYVFSRLKHSTKLSIGHDCPHTIKADMRDFIDYINIFSASPGAGTTQVNI